MSRSDLHDLSLRIRSTDPGDRAAMLAHLDRLCDASQHARDQEPRTCGAILLAAGHVIQALAADDGILDRRQTHAILCGLVQVVEKALAKRVADRADAAERMRAAQAARERSARERAAAHLPGRADPPAAVPAAPQAEPTSAAAGEARGTGAGYTVTRDMFLGEVLLGAGMITTEELAAAMVTHRRRGVRLGQALVELGTLTQEELEGGLFLQEQLQRAARLSSEKHRGPASR